VLADVTAVVDGDALSDNEELDVSELDKRALVDGKALVDGDTLTVELFVCDAVLDGDLLAEALAAGVVLGSLEGEAEQGENDTSVAAGDVYRKASPRPS
jgi:hypothetical protein